MRIIREVANSIPAFVQLCVDDHWLNLTKLQVDSDQPAPRNIQMSGNHERLVLNWEPPLTNERVMNYEITCSTTSQSGDGYIISLSVNSSVLTRVIPVDITNSTYYNCCITADIQRYAGLKFTSKSCKSIKTTSPSIPTPSDSSQEGSSILILILGVVAGVLFLGLVVMIGVSIFALRSIKKLRVDVDGRRR